MPQGIPFSEQLRAQRQEFEDKRIELLSNLRKIRIEKLESIRKSKVVVYYSVDLIHDTDAQFFYEIISRYKKFDNLDLVLFGPGGFVEPAFKISRLCQQLTSAEGQKLSVLIPYIAKSALTILALGADELVMGPVSELGPIDPQAPTVEGGIERYYPLLGIEDALEFIQKQIEHKPESALLFLPLMEKISLLSLGTYQREISSSKQYATELLQQRMLKQDQEKAKEIAETLTARYKRHAHVIDRVEARRLGLKVVDAPDDQWEVLWQLHKLYEDFLGDPQQRTARITTIIETREVTFTRPILSRSRAQSRKDSEDQ